MQKIQAKGKYPRHIITGLPSQAKVQLLHFAQFLSGWNEVTTLYLAFPSVIKLWTTTLSLCWGIPLSYHHLTPDHVNLHSDQQKWNVAFWWAKWNIRCNQRNRLCNHKYNKYRRVVSDAKTEFRQEQVKTETSFFLPVLLNCTKTWAFYFILKIFFQTGTLTCTRDL